MKLPSGVQTQRLDRVVTELLRSHGIEVSVREVRAALKDGRIKIDGRRSSPSGTPSEGAPVELDGFVARAEALVAAEPELLDRVSILFEDGELLFVAKPSGMPVAPLVPGERGTLLGAAIAHCEAVAAAGPPLEGGLGHRLDVETSGVVVFAKDPETRKRLRSAFGGCEVDKRYLCLVKDPNARWSKVEVLSTPLSGRGRRVAALEPGHRGLSAETEIHPRGDAQDGLRWLEARPRACRRHQIRVHLASAGTAIVSDPLYGELHPQVPRLALHASALGLLGRPLVRAPLPPDLVGALVSLGFAPEVIAE